MSSRDYYNSRRQPLPPIRDVLGDQLDRHPHHDDAYSVDAMQRALPSPGTGTSRSRSTWPPTTGPTLPPIHSSHSHSHHSSSHPHHSHSSHHSSHQAPGSHSHAAPYSFDVFRPSSSGLIHESSAPSAQGILRTTRADAGKSHLRSHTSSQNTSSSYHDERDDGEGEKKYACPRCGKRFGRPSSLKTHEVVHSEEKPYECAYPGCGKTFTVPSNMRRHYRKAHEGSGSADEEEAYDHSHAHNYSSPSSSYAYGGGSSSYYTSSRR